MSAAKPFRRNKISMPPADRSAYIRDLSFRIGTGKYDETATQAEYMEAAELLERAGITVPPSRPAMVPESWVEIYSRGRRKVRNKKVARAK